MPPFALSIGPQRAGTTWLDRYLRSRGDVCLPHRVKETFFFNRFYEKGAAHYLSHFRPAPAHQLCMEMTTQSFDHADAPRRTRDTLGSDIKLLCPLRHPVARSYSLYRHYKRYGIVQGDLRQAAEQVPQIITSSDYAAHLNAWYAAFGDQAIALVFQEDLEQTPDLFVRDVCRMLNLPYMPLTAELQERCNASLPPPSFAIARLAQKAGDWLRAYNGHGLIHAAKNLGLKRWIFGIDAPGAPAYRIPDADAQWLHAVLRQPIIDFENMTGRAPSSWHTLAHDIICAA